MDSAQQAVKAIVLEEMYCNAFVGWCFILYLLGFDVFPSMSPMYLCNPGIWNVSPVQMPG